MKPQKQILLDEIMADSSTQAEERLLAAMLGNVKSRKNRRTAIRVCVPLVTLALIFGAWRLNQVESTSNFYADQTPSPIKIITESNAKFELVETTASNIHYISDNNVPIQIIDDEGLEKLFEGQAYAIVDDPESSDHRFYLLGDL